MLPEGLACLSHRFWLHNTQGLIFFSIKSASGQPFFLPASSKKVVPWRTNIEAELHLVQRGNNGSVQNVSMVVEIAVAIVIAEA